MQHPHVPVTTTQPAHSTLASTLATPTTHAPAAPAPGGAEAPLATTVAAMARSLDAPLAAILQALPSLAPSPRASDPTTQRHTIERMAREAEEARAALAVLGQLCELAQGMGNLRTTSIELGDLLMSIIPTWKPTAPAHTFELALPGELPTIVADEQRIERALMLLLEHAVKMAPDGGTIRVSLRPRHEEIVISIRQQSRAVPAAQLERLFEPCARLEGCEDVVVGGGLGLALARAIVEAHGGRVWAELPDSLPGMIVRSAWPLVPRMARTLPVATAPAPANDSPPTASARLALSRTRQVVLVAMPDAPLARYLRANLEAEHFRVLLGGDAAEVYRLLELEEPDLALIDAELAGISGEDALRRLRARIRLPVILLARRHDPLECARALNAGASDYLARPFSVEELVARIRAALRATPVNASAKEEPVFSSGDLTIDYAQRAVTVGGKAVSLSKTEFKLLRALASHAGMVLSHEALLERVWGPAYQHEVEFIWVYIRRLRRKLEPDPAHPRYIQTVPGVGYRLVRA